MSTADEWDFTVPDDDAELPAELRRHGVEPAEVCYMLARDGGTASEALFLRSFKTGFFLTIADLTSADLTRAAELVEQYADMQLGGTDASVIALAERLGITDTATIDEHHSGPWCHTKSGH